jgi:MraZ protein
VEEPAKPTPVEPPRGVYPARVDEKGRLKLPVNFQQYLGNEKLFITTLDTRIARIYPISVWEQNEKLLFDQTDDTDAAEDLAFVANHFGADGDIDSQGRILLPTELRRALNLENQPVRLDYFQGAINVVSEPVYEERQKRAMADLGEKLKAMKKKGLK